MLQAVGAELLLELSELFTVDSWFCYNKPITINSVRY